MIDREFYAEKLEDFYRLDEDGLGASLKDEELISYAKSVFLEIVDLGDVVINPTCSAGRYWSKKLESVNFNISLADDGGEEIEVEVEALQAISQMPPTTDKLRAFGTLGAPEAERKWGKGIDTEHSRETLCFRTPARRIVNWSIGRFDEEESLQECIHIVEWTEDGNDSKHLHFKINRRKRIRTLLAVKSFLDRTSTLEEVEEKHGERKRRPKKARSNRRSS